MGAAAGGGWKREVDGWKTLGGLAVPAAGVEAEKEGVEVVGFAGSLGLGEKRPPPKEGWAAGCCFLSSGLISEAGLGAKIPPNGLAVGAFSSVEAGGLGAKMLLVDGGCDAPRLGFWPNNPPDAGGAGAVSLLENNEDPVGADGVNWNGDLGAESLGFLSPCGFSLAAGAPEKRLPDWNGFWDVEAPNREGAVVVVVAELV